MNKLKATWQLMRLEHGIMIFIAVLIGSIIGLNGENFPSLNKLFFGFITVLFIEASTFALNDYYDLEIDRKNKREDRPLARGDISSKTALILFYVLFPIGIISSYFINITCFIIAVITGLLGIIYDVKLKKIKILGNFYIAYSMAIPFVFGGVLVLETPLRFNIHPAIYIISLIAFLTGSGREIMKDCMDFAGDKEKGVKSFAVYLGIRKSNILASSFYIVAIGLSFLPFFIKDFGIYYSRNWKKCKEFVISLVHVY